MLGTNDTPFAAIGFEQAHRDGADMGVIAVRGVYELRPDGALTLTDEQEIVLVDTYEGDPHKTPLVRTADLVPFKPGTDVTVLGNAYPPDGKPTTSWRAGLSVGAHRHAVRVHGTREWVRHGDRLVAGESERATGVAIDWRFAWSDLDEDERGDGEVPPLNPLGVRRPVLRSDVRHAPEGSRETLAMALVDAPDEDDNDPYAPRVPQGFGPVPPFWRSRQCSAGTYGDEWLENRHPRLPADFDYRFYQAAPPSLVLADRLRGDEEALLVSLLPGRERFTFRLPGVQPVATYEWRDGREVALRCNLDGVHMDFRSPPMRVDLTWRAWLPICPTFFAIHLRQHALDDPAIGSLPRSGLHGIDGIDEFGRPVQETLA